MTAVQGWILGDSIEKTCLQLDISRNALSGIQRTSEWRAIQNFCRDEFMLTTGGRLMRIPRTSCSTRSRAMSMRASRCGDAQRGRRRVPATIARSTPKEAVSIALMMNEVNKRVDKCKAGDVTRKTWDPETWLRTLEKAAKVMKEKEIDPAPPRREAGLIPQVDRHIAVTQDRVPCSTSIPTFGRAHITLGPECWCHPEPAVEQSRSSSCTNVEQ